MAIDINNIDLCLKVVCCRPLLDFSRLSSIGYGPYFI